MVKSKRPCLKDQFCCVFSDSRRCREELTKGSLPEIARSAFKVRPPDLSFQFKGSNGKILATARSLTDLVTVLNDIPPSIVLFHTYRWMDDGLVVRSDLALWVNYVLNDVELSKMIYDLGKEAGKGELSPNDLKDRLHDICRKREQELIAAASLVIS